VATPDGAGQCYADKGVNYNNHPHNMRVVSSATVGDCCDACHKLEGCTAFTFDKTTCWLKNSTAGRVHMAGAVSGGIGPKPPMPPVPPPARHQCDQGIRESAGGQPCLWWSQGCSIGCASCATDTKTSKAITGNPPHADKIGFRKRYCNSTMEPTLPKRAWTMNVRAVDGAVNDSYRYNPWRAPGFAPVSDPCGQAGARYPWTPVGGDSSFTNTSLAQMGNLGSKVLKPTPSGVTWKTGSSVRVSWGIRYNHGGGYSYRLCKADQELTEECFQKTPLQFNRSQSALVWNNGTRYNLGDKAVFVDEGTFPKGSTWARNPIPRVADDTTGTADPAGCPGPNGRSGPRCIQFPALCPQDNGREPWSTDGSGQGACSGDWTAGVISDEVIIPKGLAPGAYVLGWRWDCEETAQIWQNCADVTIA